MVNVWQTLDIIAGPDLRRRVEGFHEIHNWLKAFSKRGSLTGRNKKFRENPSDNTTVYYAEDDHCLQTSSSAKTNKKQTKMVPNSFATIKEKKFPGMRNKKKKAVVTKGAREKQRPKTDPRTEDYVLPREYCNIVDCSFNLPRISARLERLMGTNVVRLTDRKYMYELRQRIQEDYNNTLQKRIKEREIKEIERERKVIMECKGEKISEELANHPVFIVNQRTNRLISKRRNKLKTTRERNAERLILQGAKWEKEHLMINEIEKDKEQKLQSQRVKQQLLEEKYKEEDLERGMNLLRISNENWQECEMDLKEFLEEEKPMQRRFVKKGEQYSSDPLDIANIVQARRHFRDMERKIRQQLAAELKPNMQGVSTKELLEKSSASSIASRKQVDAEFHEEIDHRILTTPNSHGTMKSNIIDELSSPPFKEPGNGKGGENIIRCSDSKLSEADHFEKNVENENIISKSKFDALHYEDPKVMELKNANNVEDLYKLAEEIINSDTPEAFVGENA